MADASSALRKLQTGQPLTDAEKKLLGISVTTPAPAASTTPAPTALEGLKKDSAETATPAPVVDEQTKSAGMRPPAPTAPVVDPTKTAYADLTASQRAAMSSSEKKDYLKAARTTSMAADATERAAASPTTDFSNRPRSSYRHSQLARVNHRFHHPSQA